MSVEQISAEELAKLFHQYHRTLAPIFECESPDADWDETRPKERKLMIATARLVLSDLVAPNQRHAAKPAVESTDEEAQPPSRPYFAKPGQAEWGC